MKTKTNKIIEAYQAAYLAANGEPINVKCEGRGWYWLPNKDFFRTKGIIEATQTLIKRSQNKQVTVRTS